MIKCPFCFKNHVANTIFCDECGQFLVQDGSASTEQFQTSEPEMHAMTWVQPPLSKAPTYKEPKIPSSNSAETAASQVCLRIGPDRQLIQFQLSESVCIGRLDPGQDIFPDIDLTQFNLEAKAVSRRHVRLFVEDTVVMVEDLDSLNGTFLNGQRLPPFLSVPLSNGDNLRLSSLQMEVSFL